VGLDKRVHRADKEPTMIVTCATCPVRGLRCDDCVVTVVSTLAVGPPGGMPLDAAERRAVGLFVSAGLVDSWYAASLQATGHGQGQAVG
jgi:hypothetical protein